MHFFKKGDYFCFIFSVFTTEFLWSWIYRIGKRRWEYSTRRYAFFNFDLCNNEMSFEFQMSLIREPNLESVSLLLNIIKGKFLHSFYIFSHISHIATSSPSATRKRGQFDAAWSKISRQYRFKFHWKYDVRYWTL